MAYQEDDVAIDGYGSPYLDSLLGPGKWVGGPITYTSRPGHQLGAWYGRGI